MSMPSLRSFVLPLLLYGSWLPGQAPVVTPSGDFYPASEEVVLHGDEKWLTFRVVDGVTGKPLPTAAMLLIAESDHPLRGEFWSSRKATADREGFVRLRVDEAAPGHVAWSWVLIRADGYGAAMFHRGVGRVVVRLSPAPPVSVRVLDWNGQPVRDALLGFCGGCGHTPDLAHGRSDANGLVQLTGIDPHDDIADLYVERQGLGMGNLPLAWFDGMAPVALRVEPGATLRGVVVDLAGKPVVGAFVGTPGEHRGPWTKTAADGTFALHGGDPRGDLHVHTGKRELVFANELLGAPIRVQLPQPDGKKPQHVRSEGAAEGTSGLVMVRVAVADATGAALPGGAFRFVGPQPKTNVTSGDVRDADAPAFLLPGRYELWTVADDHAPTKVAVEIRNDEGQAVAGQPTALPRRLVMIDRLPEQATVWLGIEDRRRDITAAVREGQPIGMPDAECAIAIEGEGRQWRVFPLARGANQAAGPLQLAWWPPTRIVGKVVDAAGAPCAAEVAAVAVGRHVEGFDPRAEIETVAARGAIDMSTELEGLAFVVVRDPAGRAHARMLPVILPPRGEAAAVDLGTVELSEASVVAVRAVDGTVFAGSVGFVRPGWGNVRQPRPQFPLAANGAFLGPRPALGDALVVDEGTADDVDGVAAFDLAVRFVVQGKAPWTFQLPPGEILLDVVGPAGTAVRGGVVLGEHHASFDGKLRLRRLPVGAQRLFVAAEGFQSAIVAVVVPADAVLPVKVVLPVR